MSHMPPALETLLGPMPVSEFVADYLHRLPLAIPGTAQFAAALGSVERLGQILDSQSAPDVLVARRGERLNEQPENGRAGKILLQAGCTVLVRHAERHDPEIAALARDFSIALQAPVDVHLYATPAESYGFSWHYDAEDVFILQTAGRKTYSLRKNTVNPWPLEETLPQDMRYEREITPFLEVDLEAGDWLYIPCGYWHKAESSGADTAVSLAVGVMSRAAVDLLDCLRSMLVESLLWRQRLPVGEASGVAPGTWETGLRDLLPELASDLSRELQSPAFLARYRRWVQSSPQ